MPPKMVGWRRPADCATSVKWARNGMPDGFPRGVGFAPRVATPCAFRSREGMPAMRRRRSRRATLFLDILILRGWVSGVQAHFPVKLLKMLLPPVDAFGFRPLPA